MRQIKKIVLHCSASDNDNTVEEINRWHKDRGFDLIGYHWYIRKSGECLPGRPEWLQGAHARKRSGNLASIGICLDGHHHFTPEQLRRLRDLIDEIKDRYGDDLKIILHNELDPLKSCPNFTLEDVYHA